MAPNNRGPASHSNKSLRIATNPAEAKAKAKEYVEKIYKNREELQQILLRREGVLRNRWLKKTQEQRTKVLLSAWPTMPKRHRPDLQTLFDLEKSPTHKARPVDPAVFAWPSMNLEDLLPAKSLLLFLNSRGRSPPHMFAHADLDACRFGRTTGYLKTDGLDGHQMLLAGQVGCDTYGKIVTAQASENTSTGGCSVSLADGLLVLHIQSGFLEFLVQCCYRIFHDIDRQAISRAQISVQPEPEPLMTSGTTYFLLSSAVA